VFGTSKIEKKASKTINQKDNSSLKLLATPVNEDDFTDGTPAPVPDEGDILTDGVGPLLVRVGSEATFFGLNTVWGAGWVLVETKFS